MGAILSSQAASGGGGKTAGTLLTPIGDSSGGQLFGNEHDFLGQMASNITFGNVGKGGPLSGVFEAASGGLDASKQTAFRTPEFGAGGVPASSGGGADSGSSDPHPTTSHAAGNLPERVTYTGDVPMQEMGGLAPSPTPSIGTGRGADKER
jgi:hypothetical protein